METINEGVVPFAPGAEALTDEGCFIVELSSAPADPALSIARARLGPGVVTRWHRLRDVAERYVVLAGEGRVEVGDAGPRDVHALDVVLIPPGARQRIANTGPADLVLLCLCTPPFRPDCYEGAEDEGGAG